MGAIPPWAPEAWRPLERVGRTYCLEYGELVKKDTVDEVAERVLALAPGSRYYLLFPVRGTAAAGAAKQAPERPALDMEALRAHLFDLRTRPAGGSRRGDRHNARQPVGRERFRKMKVAPQAQPSS